MHNRQAITPKRLWQALRDVDLWPVSVCPSVGKLLTKNEKIYLIGLLCFIPQGPPAYYLTLTLRNLGFSTVGSVTWFLD